MIYYLVQGEAYQYADRMAEMADSGAEVIFLTWDKQIDGALFLPNSTFMQGRDFLLQHVLKNNYDFEYLVFMDGDAKIIKGSWQKFNNFLLNKKPQICLPLMRGAETLVQKCCKYLGISLAMPLWKRALYIDMQTLAFRKDVVNAIGEAMHPHMFDKISQTYSGDIHLRILKYMIPHNIIRFNAVEISNNSHNNYPREHNTKLIDNYIKQIGLGSWFPFFENKIKLSKKQKILTSFINLFYLIPFPIKEFDVAKRAEYVKQCLQKIETLDIPKSKKNEGCINT